MAVYRSLPYIILSAWYSGYRYAITKNIHISWNSLTNIYKLLYVCSNAWFVWDSLLRHTLTCINSCGYSLVYLCHHRPMMRPSCPTLPTQWELYIITSKSRDY